MRKTMFLITAMAGMALSACGSEPAPQENAAAEDVVAADAVTDTTPAETSIVEPAVVTPAAASVPSAPVAFAQCKACHSVEPGKHGIGPSLAGVFGASAGHADGFAYSTAMTSSGLTWDEATLDTYLQSPFKAVPGTKMAYAGLKDDAKRAELIEYLKTL